MGLVLMKNQWKIKAVQCVQVGRTMSAGSRWTTGFSRTFAKSPRFNLGKKPVDSKETSSDVMNTMACVGPNTLPMSDRKTGPMTITTNVMMKVDLDKDDKKASEFLSRFYGYQAQYFRDMAKVHKTAMNRIKKLKRQWLKFLEKEV